MLSPTRSALLVCVLASGLAACSSGSSSGAHTSPTNSTAPTSTTVTAAQAKELAAKAILQADDLPGYSGKPATHDASDAQVEATTQKCLGAPTPHYLARNFGTQFTKGQAEIDSSADVADSVANAKTQLDALTGPKAAGCLRQSLDAVVAHSGGTVKSFSATLVPVTVPGADASFAYKFEIQAAFNAQSVTISGYEVGALVGQVEVDLQGTAINGEGPTLSQLQQLIQVATNRVRA